MQFLSSCKVIACCFGMVSTGPKNSNVYFVGDEIRDIEAGKKPKSKQ